MLVVSILLKSVERVSSKDHLKASANSLDFRSETLELQKSLDCWNIQHYVMRMTDVPTPSASSVAAIAKVSTFPHAQVMGALTDELLVNVTLQAAIYGTKLPTDQAKLLNQQVVIDSLVAVEILCAVDPFLGFELKAEGVVREGGYNSVNEAINHMLPRIEKAWNKQNKKGRTP